MVIFSRQYFLCYIGKSESIRRKTHVLFLLICNLGRNEQRPLTEQTNVTTENNSCLNWMVKVIGKVEHILSYGLSANNCDCILQTFPTQLRGY